MSRTSHIASATSEAIDNVSSAEASEPLQCDVFEEDDFTDRFISFNPTYNAESALDAHLASTHGGIRPADRPRMSSLAKSQLPPAPARRRGSISIRLRPVVAAANAVRMRRSVSRPDMLSPETPQCSFEACSTSPWSSSIPSVYPDHASTTNDLKHKLDNDNEWRVSSFNRHQMEDRQPPSRNSMEDSSNSYHSIPSSRGFRDRLRSHGVSSFSRFNSPLSRQSPRVSDSTGSSRDASDSAETKDTVDVSDVVDEAPSFMTLKNNLKRYRSEKESHPRVQTEQTDEDPWLLFRTSVPKKKSPTVIVKKWFRQTLHRQAVM